MKNFWARNGIYVAVAIVVAIAVHVTTLFMLPHFIMAQAMRKIVRDDGYNVVHHVARADEHSRVVVRPSPDLLYSICPFDLSKGALRVQAVVPLGTYWSVSVFDADTNNIFVENDRQAKDGNLDFVVLDGSNGPPDKRWIGPPRAAIRSPTARGLVLLRTLINDESHFVEIDAARRKATCGVYNSKS